MFVSPNFHMLFKSGEDGTCPITSGFMSYFYATVTLNKNNIKTIYCRKTVIKL